MLLSGVIGLPAPGPVTPSSRTVHQMRVRSVGYRTDLMVRHLAGADVVDRGGYVFVRTPANTTYYWGNFVLVPAPLDLPNRPQ